MHRDWHFVWLTGWSAHPRVWDPVLRRFPDATHQRVDFNGCHHPKSVQSRAKKALLSSPKPVHLVGWSLGAMVALELASQFPKWIRALYLIGGTGQFVRDTTYPHGWDARILKRMERRLQTHPDEVLADFDRQLFSPAEQATGWSPINGVSCALSRICHLLISAEVFVTSGISIGLHKESPWKQILTCLPGKRMSSVLPKQVSGWLNASQKRIGLHFHRRAISLFGHKRILFVLG